MKTILSRFWRPALSLVAGLAALLFFAFPHASLLNFHEQYQLFLFNADYLCERAALPGGIAAYIAQFLTQFYYMPASGATVLALMLVALQLLVAKPKGNALSYILTFIPMVLMVAAIGDESLMLAYLISINLALLLARVFMLLPVILHPMVTIVLATILSYWVAGPVAVLTGMLLAINDRSQKTWLMAAECVATVVVVFIISAIIADNIPYPADRISWGLFYYRLIAPMKVLALSVPLAIILIAITHRYMGSSPKLSDLKGSTLAIVNSAVLAVIIIGGGILINNAYSTEDHELIKYDCLLRTQKWDKIIEEANRKTPDKPFTVCALNLALGMKGQLGDEMFSYYQNGSEGLIPSFIRDYNAPMAPAEVYWQLGLVNTCQRYMFEAMEAVPDYQKSGRIVKRLVQTNIINGQYDVARKYVRLLQQTLFYRSWADSQMALLDSKEREKLINSDPLYSHMRKLRLEDDFLFSDTEQDKMMGQLFMHDSSNMLATQYLLAFPLLDKNLNLFMAYMTIIQQQKVNYIPQAANEAAAIVYSQQGQQVPPQLLNGNYARYFTK